MSEETPEVATFSAFSRSDMFTHLVDYHGDHNINSKTNMETMAHRHDQWHARDREAIQPHTHTVHVLGAVTSEGKLLAATVESPLSSSSRKALKDLVDNDFRALKSEMEQTAHDIRTQRLAGVRADWADREKERDTFVAKANALTAKFKADKESLRAKAKAKGLELHMDNYNSGASAEATGLREALSEEERAVTRDIAYALLRLERERLRAQRQVLLAGVTQEALDLLGELPTANQLMLEAAARGAEQKALTGNYES